MRSKVLEISWHGIEPVYSVDFQPLPHSQVRKILGLPSAATGSSSNAHAQSATLTPATPTLGHASPVSSSAGGSTPLNQAGGSSHPSSSGIQIEMATAGVRSYRLATAGADKTVRTSTTPNVLPGGETVQPHPPRATYLATLKRHTAPVNVVRWSPNGKDLAGFIIIKGDLEKLTSALGATGQILASAGDDGVIILWTQSDTPISTFGEDIDSEFPDKEYWRDKRIINVTKQHIYDLAWSPDGKYIIAGSTDNLAQVYNVSDGTCVHQIQDHAHYVQGVAWDPLDEYIATQSSDRTVQVHPVTHKNNTLSVHPSSRHHRSGSHSSMDIKSSRAASFSSMARPGYGRRPSSVSEAGSTVTLASEAPQSSTFLPTPSQDAAGASSSSSTTPVPSTPLSTAMQPPSASRDRPSSRRSSFSNSVAGGSPLLTPARELRATRSPSPAPLPAIRPTPLTAQTIHQKLYGDEQATTFFRRLTFAPDGSLLLTPAGQIEEPQWPPLPTPSAQSDDEAVNAASSASIPKPKSSSETSRSTVYIYSRANLHKPPVAHLPGHKTTTVCIRFSPIFYELRNITSTNNSTPKKIILDRSNPDPIHVSIDPPAQDQTKVQQPPSVFALPYRLLFAVASHDAVLLYDTQQSGPIAIFKGLHYQAFTDIAWSPTGDSMILSSADGYCSMVVFDAAELGPIHPIQQHQRQLQAIAQSHSSQLAGDRAGSSLPPSPALSNARPISQSIPMPMPSRSDRESSISSLSASGHRDELSTSQRPSESESFVAPGTSSAESEKRGFADKPSGEEEPRAKKRKIAVTTESSA